MALVQGYRAVPEFKSRKPPYCGEDTGRFKREARGENYTLAPSAFLWQIFHPELRSQMRTRFAQMDQKVKSLRVPLDARLETLHDVLKSRRTATIWIRTYWFIPISAHVVEIAGMETESRVYYGFDDMVGTEAHRPDLPIGNTSWTEEELLKVWRGGWVTGTAAIAWIE